MIKKHSSNHRGTGHRFVYDDNFFFKCLQCVYFNMFGVNCFRNKINSCILLCSVIETLLTHAHTNPQKKLNLKTKTSIEGISATTEYVYF